MVRRWAVAGVLCASALAVGGLAHAAAPATAQPGCGSVVRGKVVLRADIVGCPGDGLIVGAANTRIDLNGHLITGSKAAGSAGIRIDGYDGVRVESTAPFAAIQEFEVGIQASNARRLVVSRITTQAVVFGLRLEHVAGATVKDNNFGFAEREAGCDPATAPAAIRLFDSRRNTIRANKAQLSSFGILLIESDANTLRANGAAPLGSDGNTCSGIALIGSDRNILAGNTATENRSGNPLGGDGIHVDAASVANTLSGNIALTNIDDGIDVENATTKILSNTADRNDDLGIEAVSGVTARGNKASGNGNPAQCVNVSCR